MQSAAQRFRRLITWPARRPWVALALATVLAALALLIVSHLRPDTSLEPMFSREDPAGRAMLRVLDQFSAAEELIVLATLPDAQQNPDPQTLIAFAQRLQAALAASPRVESVVYRVDERTQQFFKDILVPNAMFYLDDAAFDQAKQRLTRSEMQKQFRQNEAMISVPGPAAQALAKAFLLDPLRLHEFVLDRLSSSRPMQTYKGSDAFVSPDGRSILIRIAGKRPPSDMEFAKELTREVSTLAEKVNTDRLNVELTGSYAIAAAAEAGIRRDMIVTVISSVVLLQLLFVLAYSRPIGMFVLAFAPVAIGVLYGFGIYASFHHTLTPMTAVIGGILAGMAIDYTIQHLAHYDHLCLAGMSTRDAAMTSTTHVGPATFGACVTSIIGFLAIGSSSVPALRDFAILGSLGLAGALVGTIFILPAVLVVTDRSASARPSSRLHLEPLLKFLQRRRRASVGVSVALLILCIIPLMPTREWLPMETDLTVMHPRPNAPLEAQRHLAERFGGSPGSLMIHLRVESPEKMVILAHDVQRRLASEEAKSAGITGSFGLATLLPDPRVTRARLDAIGPEYARRVASDFDAVVADTVFDPSAFKPYSEFLNHLLTRTGAPDLASLLPYRSLAGTILPRSATGSPVASESLVLVSARTNLDAREHRERAIAAVRSAIADYPGATLTGLSVLSHNTEQTIRRDLPRLVLTAVVLAGAYLLLHFRNLAATALALLPAIFGMVALLAFLQLTNQRLNMINLAALPLLIGIDIDYGIFIVHLARKRNSPFALSELAPACHAVILCAASTMLGFASLITTSVPAVRSLGIVMAFGVGSCLFATLFLLLPMLLKRESKSEGERRAA